MRVAITGASGLIGQALVSHLEREGHDVVPVVRRAASGGEISWDPDAGRVDSLSGVDAVVHLAAAGIGDKRWTEDYKRQILESRTNGTRLIADAIASSADGPRLLLSASAIGIYGPSESATFDETSPVGEGFLADVCREWEAATSPAEAAGVRVAHLRTGVVLSTRGGALKKQLPLFRAGLGGKFGDGHVWQSWISIDDEVSAIAHLLESELSGPVNLTAPHPVTQAEFVAALGAELHRPTFMRVPRFAPGLLLGRELVDNLLFSGQKVLPRALLGDGYEFHHARIADALTALLDR
jgi:uncharacterized protein (TIGR01777 family)